MNKKKKKNKKNKKKKFITPLRMNLHPSKMTTCHLQAVSASLLPLVAAETLRHVVQMPLASKMCNKP